MPVGMPIPVHASGAPRAAETPPARQAAQAFEAMLVQQLLRTMRATVPSAEGPSYQRDLYFEMFDEAIAEQISKGEGIGLAQTFEAAFGGESGAGETVHRSAPQSLAPASAPAGIPLPGGAARIQRAAGEMIAPGSSTHWGRDGALGPQDLRSEIETPVQGGAARFNVLDARGYEGYYKCNLFAFEVARRAGYAVPVIPRGRGWGFPGADAVARDAADGGVRGGWAHVATGASASALDRSIREEGRGYMLAGSAPGEAMGHMAVVERVHRVEYGPDGAMRRIVFDGWETSRRGARHLVDRTWNFVGNPGGTNQRNGFDRIEIMELLAPAAGGAAEVSLGTAQRPSLLDSSPDTRRPNPVAEVER